MQLQFTCSVVGCVQPLKLKRERLCNAHWLRRQRYGDFRLDKPVFQVGRSPNSRFWEKVQRSDDGCWEWTGATSSGYGAVWIEGARPLPIRAHILSFWIHYGNVPTGAYICHHCDNKLCVRPDHIYAGSAKTNAQDMIRRGRAGAQVGHVAKWTHGRH